MKKKTGIFSSLVKNYIIFIVALIGALIISSIFIGIGTSSNVSLENMPNIGIWNKVGSDYQNFDTKDIESLNGYLEILDENNNVIYTKGEVKEQKTKYTQSELIQLTDPDADYKVFLNTFKNKDNKEYTSIVKIPSSMLITTYNLQNAPYNMLSSLYNELIKGIILIITLVILSIILFSFWTAKKISSPLNKIIDGLEEVINENYNEKLDFRSEKEFESLRDTFNILTYRLKEKEEENKKLEESKKRLLADISHDIKTPITAIKGLSQALCEGVVTDSKKDNYYERIYNKSELVSELVEDLFQFIKLDSSDYELNLNEVNICEFMRRVIVNYYEDLEDKEFDFSFDIPEDNIYASIDERLISRVLSNLVENSIKYNSNKTKFYISIKDDNDSVIIRICDNGKGIDIELQDNIFDAFVRGDDSRSSEGSGLGLAISKKIIDRHNGKIKLITNNKEYKTIFEIELKKSFIKAYNEE